MTTKNLPATKPKFPVAIVFDEAQNVLERLAGKPVAYDDNDLKTLYGLTDDELKDIRSDKEFALDVVVATQELKESGDGIRQKMKAQFNEYLDCVIPKLMASPDTAAKDIVSVMMMLGKGSGLLEDTKAKQELEQMKSSNSAGPTFNLILTQAPVAAEPRVINQE